MKIAALRLYNVRRFAGRGVAIEGIGDGVNVLSAANEFGKSTSFAALHALFFQPHSSVSADIRGLRPYSGGNPLVEADIATGSGRFRITKQYYGGRSARVLDLETGRLLAQADEAEAFISNLVGGGSAGPAGLLWVRQGLTGIEKRPRSEEEDEREIRRSLLESVQGEVEAVTGGRRMAEILETVTGELDALVSKRGPRAGGRYAAALEERDRLAAEESRLASDVAALREALEKRASAARRLLELDRPEERQERKRATEAAQIAFDAARGQSEKLRTADAECKLATERHEAAQRDLAACRAALDRAEALRAQRHDAGRRRDEATARRRKAGAAVAAARAAAEAAETEEGEARQLLTRLDAALRARAARERLAEIGERLERAEETRKAIEAGEARLMALALPPGAIDALHALDLDIAARRARRDAARPSVWVSYEPGAAGAVTMDGRALAEGEERGYEGEARLLVRGIGTLTLRANQPVPGEDGLARAEDKRAALLASMGVADLSAARRRETEANSLTLDLRELAGRLSQLAPDGLARLRAEAAVPDAADAEPLELKAEPAEVRAALETAEARLSAARLALREAEPLRAGADDAFVSAETALAALAAEQAQIEAVLGPEDLRAERERHLSAALDERARARAEAEARADALRAAAADLASREAALRRARSAEDAASQETGRLREAVAGLNAEIRARAEDAVEEKWRETAEALAAATARAAAFETEISTLRKLASALETARSEARDIYLKPVMAELTPLLGLLFDDVAISFDEKTLLPQAIRRNGQEEDVDRLSGGMREQLSILTRLAFARLLARDGRPAPVILDDALVYSDDDRIERMFDALHRQSRDQQIIVFSCRQRAFQKLGGTILHMTDWQP